MRPLVLFALIFLMVHGPAAWGAGPLTLQQAMSAALQNHPDVLSAEYNADAAQQSIADARSVYLPQLTGDAVRTFDQRGTVLAASGGLVSSSVIERGSVGLGLSQLITDFGRTSNLIASSQFESASEKEQAGFVRDTVLLNAISAYYEVLRSQALLQVAKDALQTRRSLFDQVSALRKAKMKSDLDVTIAQSAVADANLLFLKAQGGVDEAQATLSEAMGLSQSPIFTLTDQMNITAPPPSVGPLISAALDQNPEITALRDRVHAIEKQEAAAGDAKYPTISAVGYAGETPYRVDDQPIARHYEAGGFLVSVPFFTGGRITAEERAAEYRARAAREDLTARMNVLQRDVRVAYDNVQTAYQNIEVTKELLESTHQSLKLTQAGYQLGRSSIVDLNVAQLADTRAAITQANADYDYLIQRAILDYRVGNMTQTYPSGS